MVDDALSAGGIVKINTDLLKKFATMNLRAFLDDLENNADVDQMKSFSQGAGSGPAYGPSRHFMAVLPGNGTSLPSAGQLREGFHATAGYFTNTVKTLVDNAEKMRSDLMAASDTIDAAENEAGLTADQMRTDLSDVNGSTTVAPPVT
jgi:hypothetical protein